MQITIYILLVIVVILMWVLIYNAVQRSKQGNLTEQPRFVNRYLLSECYHQKKETVIPRYYCLQSCIDDHNRKIDSIKREIKILTAQRINYEKLLLQKHSYAEIEAKKHLLRNCYNIIMETNDIDVLYNHKKIADKILSRLNGVDCGPIEDDDDYLLKNFKHIFNNMICRIASYKMVAYKIKFYELKMERSKQMHTQKIFIDLDTLKVMVDMDSNNHEETFNILREQYAQVEELSNYLKNY